MFNKMAFNTLAFKRFGFKRFALRESALLGLLFLVMLSAGCGRHKAANPIADLDSKQPDKVLFDRAMDALKRNKFDVARLTLQTLINTYPDSEYIARAKLGVADSWYREGGATGLAQAEVEYKDFQTFFPNMTEASEAQLKIAGIHYRQMMKPDRDYTHAKRAEDEYRQLILQYPDSPLVPEAKARLREVQEVLGEREYRIGRFYFLRESWPAAIARLKTLVDAYPLYSNVDDALMMLAGAYESQMQSVKTNAAMPEQMKARLMNDFSNKAASAYDTILTRYPAMDQAKEAAERLKAMNRPIPQATPAMLAQNKAEEESRKELGTMSRVMGNFKSRPETARAVSVGEPSITDPKPTNPSEVVKDVLKAAGTEQGGSGTTGAEIIKGKPGENQPVPRSESSEPTTPPPAQVNEAAGEKPAATTAEQDKKAKEGESSSKKKKKKGLGKLNPFGG